MTQSEIGWVEIPQRSGRLAHRIRYIEATRRRTTPAVMGARGMEFRLAKVN